MIRQKHILPAIILTAAAGCSSLPDRLTPEDASQYYTIDELILDTTGFEPSWDVKISDDHRFDDITKPHRYISAYCTYQGGQLIKGKPTQKSPYEEVISALPYQLPPNAQGTFECKQDGKTKWAVEITITNVKVLDPDYNKVRFTTKVESLTPSQLVHRLETRARLDQEEARQENQMAMLANREKIAKEELRALKERRQQEKEQLLREHAKDQISHSRNIGQKVCRSGELTFPYFTGNYNVLAGNPQYSTHRQPGLLMAYLEGFSEDRYRVKLRMAGWAANTNYGEPPKPSDHPLMEGISSRPGTVQWVDVKDWYLCP